MKASASRRQESAEFADGPNVIWILGILQRSGTNYLRDLLALHRDCRTVDPVGEDFLLAHADRLNDYACGVAGDWNRDWDPHGNLRQELLNRLNRTCLDFLHARAGSLRPNDRILSKTPSVKNLGLLPQFPRARAVVIVRDGRDMIVSGMKSFGWKFEDACRRWADAARSILAARVAGVPFVLVRYEDLLVDLRGELSRIFDGLELDPAGYDFEAAAGLPVKGSSTFGRSDGQVHWNPVQKTGEFQPVRRWSHWSAARRSRFNWIAGAESAALGYDTAEVSGPMSLWRIWNKCCDLRRSLRVPGRIKGYFQRRKRPGALNVSTTVARVSGSRAEAPAAVAH